MTQLIPDNYQENAEGQTMTTTFTMEFSGPTAENPFMNSYIHDHPEFSSTNGVLAAIQAAFPGKENDVSEVFNSTSSFTELAHELCERFGMNGWSVAIGDHTMNVSVRVTVNDL